MLSNDPIVRVQVTASNGAASAASFDTGLILTPAGAASVTETERLRVFNSAADMLTAGFSASDEAYTAAVKYFSASPSPAQLLVSKYPSGETPGAALDAVLERSASFYGIYLCVHDASAMKAFAAHVAELDGRFVYFYTVVDTVANALLPSGIFAGMKTAGNGRALGLFAAANNDAAAVMGLAMGLTLARQDRAFALCYKALNGVETTALTESEVSALKALNANVYVARGYTRTMLESGTVGNGRRYDEVMYLDRMTADLQEAAVALLADNAGKLAQTDETSAVFINRFTSILAGYAGMGVLGTAVWRGAEVGPLTAGDMVENGFLLWAESYDTQSDADRAAHKAMPIHAALCFAGSVESLVIDIHVTA